MSIFDRYRRPSRYEPTEEEKAEKKRRREEERMAHQAREAAKQARNKAGFDEEQADITNRGFDPRDPTENDTVAATVNRERDEDALAAELTAHANETYVDASYDEEAAPDMDPENSHELPVGVREVSEAELVAENDRILKLEALQEGRLQDKLDAHEKQ